jgi:hypothetical protein
MGIPTLITTNTESGDATSSFTSGINSTYDEYMFVFTDIGPATDDVYFTFQGSIDGGSNYNVTITTSNFRSGHTEGDETDLAYDTGGDTAQGTGFQRLSVDSANDADGSGAGILHLFSPSSTTYVKHFYSTYHHMTGTPAAYCLFVAGYFNTTSAIDAIQFKPSSGDFDGVIQMYGIS